MPASDEGLWTPWLGMKVSLDNEAPAIEVRAIRAASYPVDPQLRQGSFYASIEVPHELFPVAGSRAVRPRGTAETRIIISVMGLLCGIQGEIKGPLWAMVNLSRLSGAIGADADRDLAVTAERVYASRGRLRSLLHEGNHVILEISTAFSWKLGGSMRFKDEDLSILSNTK